MSGIEKKAFKRTLYDFHDFCKIKHVICFILSFVGCGFLVLSLVCLAGNGKSSTMKSISSLHSQSTVSSFYAPSNANGGEDLVNDNERKSLTNELKNKSHVNEEEGGNLVEEKEEKEEEEEEERRTSENVTHVIFLWHYTSAAVCFSVFIVIVFFMLLFAGKLYFDDDAFFLFGNYRRFVVVLCLFSVLAILMAVLPATRMDGFLKGSYWIFFIPYLLFDVLVPIVVVVYYVMRVREGRTITYGWHNESEFSCFPAVPIAAFWLLSLVGHILWILKLDDVLPPSFKYTFVFLFIGLGVSCGIYAFFYTVFIDEDDDDDHDEALVPGAVIFCIRDSCGFLFAPAVLYAGFVLPFSLRKDLVLHTSYHFPLIPHYLLCVVFLICLLVFAVTAVKEDGTFIFVVFLIMSILATVFLVLSLVCLGGTSDASEKHPAGRGGSSGVSLSSAPSFLSLLQQPSIRPSSAEPVESAFALHAKTRSSSTHPLDQTPT